MRVSKLFITAAVALGVLLIVAIYSLTGKPSPSENNSVPGTTASASPQDNVDSTASWRTYTNKRYGYAVRYPAYWFTDTTLGETDFIQRGPEQDQTFMGGDVIFSNYDKPTGFDVNNAPDDIFNVHLVVWKVDPSMSYGQFILQNHFVNGSEETITINGLSAVRLIATSNEGPTVVNTLIKVDSNMFVFTYTAKTDDLTDTNIAKQIVESFERVSS